MFSSALKTMFDDVILPALLTAAGTAIPLFGFVLAIPVLGPLTKKAIQWIFDSLYDQGVIELKIALIDKLSTAAKEKYAAEIAVIREAQKQTSLTPEQEAEYAKRLQDLIKNRPGIVNG